MTETFSTKSEFFLKSFHIIVNEEGLHIFRFISQWHKMDFFTQNQFSQPNDISEIDLFRKTVSRHVLFIVFQIPRSWEQKFSNFHFAGHLRKEKKLWNIRKWRPKEWQAENWIMTTGTRKTNQKRRELLNKLIPKLCKVE